MARLTPGTRISDTLVCDQPLGEGAYAEVYRVRHRFLGWQAMKLFKRVTSLEETDALLGEARLLSTLGHPNIVRLFEASTLTTDEGSSGYFTMEYVPGGSLQRLLRTYESTGVPMHLALPALAQIAAALAAAHRQRPPILHRDLTPANVLVGYDESGLRARLGDFGLARHVDPVTQFASAQGTFAYLAPEVIRGDGYTRAGDVWSWGALAYLLLTGHLPYGSRDGFDPRSLRRFRTSLLPPSGYNDDVGPELDRIVLAALELAPRDRPADAQQLCDDLRGPAAGSRQLCDDLRGPAAGSRQTPDEPRGPAHRPPPVVRAPPGETAGRLAEQALTLARDPASLIDAADLMEEAVSLSASLRERYRHRLTLWRRGVMM